jgi:hypothetical protein
MFREPIPCDPVVSIQRVPAPDPVQGHLSWGTLVDPGHVAVPGPLDWLSEPRFEVLLASAPYGDGIAERIPVGAVDMLGLESAPGSAAAVLELAYPSRHVPSRREVDLERLEAELAGAADVWSALERTGAVPTGVRDLPVADVLAPVVEWEQAGRAALVRGGLGRDPGEVGIQWCRILRTCGCRDRWW